MPNKDTTEYKTPVEFLEGLTRLLYNFKTRGKLFIAKELIEGKRKDPYVEPDIKDFGTRVETIVEDVETATAAEDTSSQSGQTRRKAASATETQNHNHPHSFDRWKG